MLAGTVKLIYLACLFDRRAGASQRSARADCRTGYVKSGRAFVKRGVGCLVVAGGETAGIGMQALELDKCRLARRLIRACPGATPFPRRAAPCRPEVGQFWIA